MISTEEAEALRRTRRGQDTVIIVENPAAKYQEALAYCAEWQFHGKKPNKLYAVHWVCAPHDGICFVIGAEQIPEALMGLTFRFAAMDAGVSEHHRSLVMERVLD